VFIGTNGGPLRRASFYAACGRATKTYVEFSEDLERVGAQRTCNSVQLRASRPQLLTQRTMGEIGPVG
jgi:hypothetical protein